MTEAIQNPEGEITFATFFTKAMEDSRVQSYVIHALNMVGFIPEDVPQQPLSADEQAQLATTIRTLVETVSADDEVYKAEAAALAKQFAVDFHKLMEGGLS
jgi:hypothetical protein